MQEKDAAPQESDAPHSWLQVESLHRSLASPLPPLCPCFCCLPILLSSSPRAEGLCSSCPERVPISLLASKPRRWKSCCAWQGLGCGWVEGVETIFIAYMPKAFASRLCEVCCCFSVRWLALPYASQLAAARALSYFIWYRGPAFIQYFIRNILRQINSLWCQWILF